MRKLIQRRGLEVRNLIRGECGQMGHDLLGMSSFEPDGAQLVLRVLTMSKAASTLPVDLLESNEIVNAFLLK